MTPEQQGRRRDRRRAYRRRRKAKETLLGYDMLTMDCLTERAARLQAGGWPVSKWIIFCREILLMGLHVAVYEAKTTRSKYVYVASKDKSRFFKVRFSNHRPAVAQQDKADSDFYVGVSNGLVTTTEDALRAVRTRFAEELQHEDQG